MKEVVMVLGYQASGKTTYTLENFPNYFRLNRDKEGGTLQKLATKLDESIVQGKKQIVLDNTFPTQESREPFLKIAKKHKIPARAIVIDATIEDAQFNAAHRMLKKYKKLLDAEEAKATKDDNCFSINVLFHYRKIYQEASTNEGFSEIIHIPFERKPFGYKNKALILDYDGTLRQTKSKSKYPIHPNDIEILPNRKETLEKYRDQGYLLVGASNQSGIADKKLSTEDAIACFERTNELLGHNIDYIFCPHGAYPPQCFCRKPCFGSGVVLMERYKLDLSKCIVVGDMTSDATFAKRGGVKYIAAEKFFA